jgi:hypothetical protein
MGKHGMYGGHIETIAVNEIYKMFVNSCLVHDGQMTQPTIINITVSQVVTKRNIKVG